MGVSTAECPLSIINKKERVHVLKPHVVTRSNARMPNQRRTYFWGQMLQCTLHILCGCEAYRDEGKYREGENVCSCDCAITCMWFAYVFVCVRTRVWSSKSTHTPSGASALAIKWHGREACESHFPSAMDLHKQGHFTYFGQAWWHRIVPHWSD